jgi:hypothetical protein
MIIMDEDDCVVDVSKFYMAFSSTQKAM